MDLRLASARAPEASSQSPTIWLGVLLGTLLVTGFCVWRARASGSLRIARRLPSLGVLGVYTLLVLGWINWPRGWHLLLWPLRSVLETALLVLIAACVGLAPRTLAPSRRGKARGWILALLLIHLGVHGIEQGVGHALVPLGGRIALQALLFAALGVGLVRLGQRTQSFETRATAWCLGVPLLVRLACVGSWTALLGVTVPESLTGISLGVWSLSGLLLCACTFPRQKGLSWLYFALCAGLGTGAVFLVFFHYLHRFGRIQVVFNELSTLLFGVHFPYPQWQSPAFAAGFAVSCVFVLLLVLRTLGTPGIQKRGLALGLWFTTGIGLMRSTDLVLLLFATLVLYGSDNASRPSKP